jgi:transcription elongation factor Elf1
VNGIHQGIVTPEIFYRANDVLNGRKRNTDFKSDKTNLYPLRGVFKCPVHGTTLTSYASTGRKNRKYHYYLCVKCGTSQRHRLQDVHKSIEEILSKITANAQSLKLYNKILEKCFDREDLSRKKDIEELKKQIDQEEKRLSNLTMLLLDKKIDADDYQRMKQQIDKILREVQSKLDALSKGMTPFKQYISKQIPILHNLLDFYKTADGITKRKIIGCIFSEKVILEKGRVATTPYSPGVMVMFNIVNALQGSKKKTGGHF